jgi:carboxylesterase type B
MYLLLITIALINFSFINNEEIDKSTIVNTISGQIKGSLYHDTLTNSSVTIFQGIPYAKPPIGELRFKYPEPIENWSGILDATHGNNTIIRVKNIKNKN